MKQLLAALLSVAFAGAVLAQSQSGLQIAQATDTPKADANSHDKGATKSSSKKSSKKKHSKSKSKSSSAKAADEKKS
jgi:uncharacterized protein YdeI (BOF family)